MVVVFIVHLTGQIHLGASSKFLSVKDGREATKAAGLAMVLMLLGSAIWFIPPMVARFIYAAEVEAPEVSDPATAAYAVAAGGFGAISKQVVSARAPAVGPE